MYGPVCRNQIDAAHMTAGGGGRLGAVVDRGEQVQPAGNHTAGTIRGHQVIVTGIGISAEDEGSARARQLVARSPPGVTVRSAA